VDELDARGVNVSIGHDSIMDPWYPMGKGSMLQGANLLMHTAHMSGYDQIPRLFDMITGNSARTMHVSDRYGIEAGKPADLVVLDAESDADAIRLMAECLFVIKDGKVIVESKPAQRTLTRDAGTEMVDFRLKGR